MRGCIILANGRPPEKKQIEYFSSHGFPYLICADGGADTARDLGLEPNLIAGDLDSVTPATLEYFDGKAVIEKIDRQDDTDMEKCIKLAIRDGFTRCVIMGATGDRLDHSFNNLGIAFKYNEQITIILLSESSCMQIITGHTQVKGIPGETVSLFGLDDKTRFTTIGLAYPLNNESLPFGVRDGTSNSALTGEFEVIVKGGTGIMMREIEKVIESGSIDSN